ncbi:hydrolase [Nitrococcus mobilis]|uniref:Alpha/beta hydrolase fold protein n=1 Tax=Nitrococcus mobilis Nb-231 TaxID=314278 RepID=A4BM22_9GAMM|nr:hydrolase [Nitrococcus mobilis]EAR23360.1 Alpha/beta hydrolase fold protein [Nitrococcus mobilis Nb-231]
MPDQKASEHAARIASDAECAIRFRPAWWLLGGNGQTLWPALVRRPPKLPVQWQWFVLPDQDCLNLAWGPRRDGALILILHGLGGCATAGYALGMLRVLSQHGLQGVIMEYRGAGSWPNRSDRFYHAGAWQDLQIVVQELRACCPNRPIGVVGFSLGGSILLNWLIADSKAPVDAAVAISVPFDLAACTDTLNRSFARVYQWDLLRRLKQRVRRKYANQDDAPISIRQLRTVRTLRAFDNHITAPLHGYIDAADYYRRCSCGPHLHAIRHATLIIHAHDDPFAPLPSIVLAQQLAPCVQLELTPSGGHVGFVQGRWPWYADYWLEQRIITYFLSIFKTVG